MRATDNPPATIPAEILNTLARPDIVIVRDSEITLIELTVPYNSPDCLKNGRLRKENKELYQHALSDLGMVSALVVSELLKIEVGALGHCFASHTLCSTAADQISSFSKSTATQLLDSAAKAIITSHRIFYARLNPTWN